MQQAAIKTTFRESTYFILMSKVLFGLLLVYSLFCSPAIALFVGIAFSMLIGNPYGKFSKVVSKYLLQAAVVGLGFGMNIFASLQAGKEGITFTIISVTGVMVIGVILGKVFHVIPKLAYLISAGTAICGGSAIAAISPVVKANEHETSMSLAVIFTLNAIALFIYPPIGHYLGLSQSQFGLWSAIAIHDTSSVVGAAAIYGDEALKIATTIKMTRALWIIPLSIVSIFIFRSKNAGEKRKISIPWFIFLFILAMIVNTYISLPHAFTYAMSIASHRALSVTLFLIGTGLSVFAIKKVGYKPVLLGITLWFIISITTLIVCQL